jgi:hypothetical protein
MRRRRGVIAVVLAVVAAGGIAAILTSLIGPGARRVRPAARVDPSPTPHRRGQTGALSRGSDPRALPGAILIADRDNNRVIEVDPEGRVVWRFPRRGDLRRGVTFLAPDDAFFTADGRRIVVTQEDDFVITLIDVARHRIVYRYGTPGVPGSGANQLFNPDDALPTARGEIVSADIKNCRLLMVRPPRHRPIRQLGGTCVHDPPAGFASPNGAFPTAGGGMVVTEISGDWADLLDRRGRLVRAVHPPGLRYPSDTNQVRPDLLLSVDYTQPGAVETFSERGRLRWRYAPAGRQALDQPSIALPLPNGDVLICDDYNHRVIAVDPRSNRVVWQYGHTGKPGRRLGYLSKPDGVDLAPPHALVNRLSPQGLR